MSGTLRESPPLRYVVLRHEGIDDPHYDLMFETAPASLLATWRAPYWPLKPLDPIEWINDHRREYLDYEGPVSANRGHVRRIASGTHSISQDLPAFLITRLDNGTRMRLSRSWSATPAQLFDKD